jgi:membrane protein insertase Oxa1/YidC/SpoIIIJ
MLLKSKEIEITTLVKDNDETKRQWQDEGMNGIKSSYSGLIQMPLQCRFLRRRAETKSIRTIIFNSDRYNLGSSLSVISEQNRAWPSIAYRHQHPR